MNHEQIDKIEKLLSANYKKDDKNRFIVDYDHPYEKAVYYFCAFFTAGLGILIFLCIIEPTVPRLKYGALAYALLAAIFWGIYFQVKVTHIFDVDLQKIIHQKYIFGTTTEEVLSDFDQIVCFYAQGHQFSDKHGTTYSYRPVTLLNTGKIIHLAYIKIGQEGYDVATVISKNFSEAFGIDHVPVKYKSSVELYLDEKKGETAVRETSCISSENNIELLIGFIFMILTFGTVFLGIK